MGNRTTHVDSANAAEDDVGGFNIAKLLSIADSYTEEARRDDEFATTFFAKSKGWTYEKAMTILLRMEADGYVTRRKVGRLTLWRVK